MLGFSADSAWYGSPEGFGPKAMKPVRENLQETFPEPKKVRQEGREVVFIDCLSVSPAKCLSWLVLAV